MRLLLREWVCITSFVFLWPKLASKAPKPPLTSTACRLPGDCNSPTDFWELLYTQRDVQSKVPEDRFSAEAFYHPRMSRPGSIHLKGGYFINDAKSFDPTFFNIPAQEALSLDPKQRKVLEVSYEALESAGVPLSSIAGARIGCFVANFTFDYQTMAYRDVEFSSSSAYMQTGLGATLLSNRVSYIFNLTGPRYA